MKEPSEFLPRTVEPPPDALKGMTLKVAAPCNFACTYCFEYPEGKDTWDDLPRLMSPEVVEAAARRLGTYATEHNLPKVFVTFHGGEPLLLGADGLAQRAQIIQQTLPCEVSLGIQTNGSLLTDSMAGVLEQYGFRVGISLDGERQANDRFRIDHSGRGTYGRVLDGIKTLQASNLDWGLLSVINLENDPLQTYDYLVSLEPPLGMDFLLPHGNYTNRPPGHTAPGQTPYADWLIPIFDQYISSEKPLPRIRKFVSIINMFLGQETRTESLGNPPLQELFVRTDGSYYDNDALLHISRDLPALKVSDQQGDAPGAERTMNVFRDSFAEVLEHPWITFRRLGRSSLSQTCQDCRLVSICGGGYFPHRYDASRADDNVPYAAFRNPSVYCPDLIKLITHIGDRLRPYFA